jgi:hypothetical protein
MNISKKNMGDLRREEKGGIAKKGPPPLDEPPIGRGSRIVIGSNFVHLTTPQLIDLNISARSILCTVPNKNHQTN